MSMALLPKISPRSDDQRRQQAQHSLLTQEAQIGGQLFGPVPKGHVRQFFNLDPHIWVWYEEWKDAQGTHTMTTRYEIRSNGVLKLQDGQPYRRLSHEEARNLYWAIDAYLKQVGAYYEQLLQTA